MTIEDRHLINKIMSAGRRFSWLLVFLVKEEISHWYGREAEVVKVWEKEKVRNCFLKDNGN